MGNTCDAATARREAKKGRLLRHRPIISQEKTSKYDFRQSPARVLPGIFQDVFLSSKGVFCLVGPITDG
jgi:hypothetical protein